MKTENDTNGYLLLHKNPGQTSFDSLSMVKKALGTSRVGHAGTLDKFAGGLLIVLTGRCTKLIPWFLNCDKNYEGIIKFGVETDTLDPEGQVVKECAIPSREAIESSIPRFIGKIMQKPPVYSSIHINGKRAHTLARAGAEVSMQERPVEIYSLGLDAFDQEGKGTIRVACSKGTYIRSLARDLAYDAGSCGHLVYLNRSGIAGFSLDQAVNPSAESDPAEAVRKALKPVNQLMFRALHIPCITVDDRVSLKFIHGRPIEECIDTSQIALTCTDKDTVLGSSLAIFSQNGDFIGIIQESNGTWQYGYIYARN